MKGHIFLKFIERVQSFFDLSLWPVSCLRSCEEKKLWNNFFTNFMSACSNAPCKANLISHSERSNHLCKKNLYKVPTPKTIIGEVVTEIFLSISRLIFAKLAVF